jgi:hypothetical protein
MPSYSAKAGSGIYRCTGKGETKYVNANGQQLGCHCTPCADIWYRYVLDNTRTDDLIPLVLYVEGNNRPLTILFDDVPVEGGLFNLMVTTNKDLHNFVDGQYQIRNFSDTMVRSKQGTIQATRVGDLDDTKSVYAAWLEIPC